MGYPGCPHHHTTTNDSVSPRQLLGTNDQAGSPPGSDMVRTNKKFMKLMREHYNDVAEQQFKMTVVRAEPAATGHSTPMKATKDKDEWESPMSLDATEPRLELEAVPDDALINPVAAFGMPA